MSILIKMISVMIVLPVENGSTIYALQNYQCILQEKSQKTIMIFNINDITEEENNVLDCDSDINPEEVEELNSSYAVSLVLFYTRIPPASSAITALGANHFDGFYRYVIVIKQYYSTVLTAKLTKPFRCRCSINSKK